MSSDYPLSFDPNAAVPPSISVYPAAPNNIITIDPTTGAIIFPTDIETSNFQSLTAKSFTTVVLPAGGGKDYVQQILFTVSGQQFTLDYTTLQNTINNNNISIYTALGLYLLSSDAANAYQTIANMTNYLTTTAAASTYQTIASMTSYLTTTAAASTYLATTAAASTYQTIANMTSYLTTTAAASTYQTIANMTNYLTTTGAASTYLATTAAASTYQTIANMTNYLTTTTAASTYQTIANMTNYLTTTVAASTYAPKASPTFTGTLTCPTINASSILDLNGVNINTIYAPLATPTFTGTLTAPIINASSTLQVGGANISTTYAALASPAFTGNPTAVTQATTDSSTKLATTAYVQNNIVNTPTTRLQFYCSSSGSITTSTTGVYTASLASYTTGTYAITFSGSVSGYPTIQCLSPSASVNYNANLVSWTGTSCTVVIKDSSNALQNASFWFTVLA